MIADARVARSIVAHAGRAARLEAELVAAQAAADRVAVMYDLLVRAVGDAGVVGPVLRAVHGKQVDQ